MPSPVDLPYVTSTLSRRRWLGAHAALAALAIPAVVRGQTPARPPSPFQSPPAGTPQSHAPFGRVYPQRQPPDLHLTMDDGTSTSLRALLRGRITALQLMFTGCSATCPIQGALFAEVARRGLPRDAQLLSFSIDPLGDSPKAMREWMLRFGPNAAWRAAIPRP
jgi:protein SCO1